MSTRERAELPGSLPKPHRQSIVASPIAFDQAFVAQRKRLAKEMQGGYPAIAAVSARAEAQEDRRVIHSAPGCTDVAQIHCVWYPSVQRMQKPAERIVGQCVSASLFGVSAGLLDTRPEFANFSAGILFYVGTGTNHCAFDQGGSPAHANF